MYALILASGDLAMGTVDSNDLQFLEKTTNALPVATPQSNATSGETNTTFTFTASA